MGSRGSRLVTSPGSTMEAWWRRWRGSPTATGRSGPVNFRSAPRFETAAGAHQWLTRPLFIASGARYPDRVSLSVFEVGLVRVKNGGLWPPSLSVGSTRRLHTALGGVPAVEVAPHSTAGVHWDESPGCRTKGSVCRLEHLDGRDGPEGHRDNVHWAADIRRRTRVAAIVSIRVSIRRESRRRCGDSAESAAPTTKAINFFMASSSTEIRIERTGHLAVPRLRSRTLEVRQGAPCAAALRKAARLSGNGSPWSANRSRARKKPVRRNPSAISSALG